MARLVEDLMTVARSETDDIRFERDPIDLAEVAAEAAREADVLAAARGLAIETSSQARLSSRAIGSG